jgi:peroxiredoxin
MTTIAEQVNEVKAAAAGRLPAEVAAAFAADRAALAAGGIPTGAVAVGDKLSAFALPDATGTTRTLDELTADGPAVIVFYRGGWCPYCNVTLRTYERDLMPQLAAYSARLVAISPETPDASLSTQERAELTYTVLSDAGAQLADTLGITFDPSEEGLAAQRTLGLDIRTTRADDGTRLPMPTVLIVDPDHVVRFADIQPDYTARTEAADIITALKTLTTS